MVIDNFDLILSKLTFESDFDRYIVHIIKRAKDDEGKNFGVNETNRLLKTFYITSKEYFEKKRIVIETLCRDNKARAYILPQVRNNSDCLMNLLKITVDNLKNPTQKPDHLVRSAYCGFHGSRDKKWILDIDKEFLGRFDEVFGIIKENLSAIGKNPDDMYVVNTKSGKHIVTSPFNVLECNKKCPMIFEGQRWGYDLDVCREWIHMHGLDEMFKDVVLGEFTACEQIDEVITGIDFKNEFDFKRLEDSLFNCIRMKKQYTGFLIKDGMTLLYYNDGKSEDVAKDLKFVGWGDYIKFSKVIKELPNIYTTDAEYMIHKNIVENRFAFSGEYHQNGEFGCPIFEVNGERFTFLTSWRYWGGIMADAWNVINNPKCYDYIDFYMFVPEEIGFSTPNPKDCLRFEGEKK